MKVLALDLSTKTGWSIFVDGLPVAFGCIENKLEWGFAKYPENFLVVAETVALSVLNLIEKDYKTTFSYITDVVIEEINKTGRFGSRHSQKLLDFIHFAVCDALRTCSVNVHYINTSDWRKALKLSVSETKKAAKEPLKQLALLQKQFVAAKGSEKKVLKEKVKSFKETLKVRCIHGKIDKKSISVAYANATWNMNLKKGDNDIADSLCQGQAFIKGCPVLTNKDIFDNTKKRNK